MNRIQAPFTPDQVVALNRWQAREDVHPFTCQNRGDAKHRGEGELFATSGGWICPFCEYRQDWAHDMMAAGSSWRAVIRGAVNHRLQRHLESMTALRDALQSWGKVGPIEHVECSDDRVASMYEVLALGFFIARGHDEFRTASPQLVFDIVRLAAAFARADDQEAKERLGAFEELLSTLAAES